MVSCIVYLTFWYVIFKLLWPIAEAKVIYQVQEAILYFQEEKLILKIKLKNIYYLLVSWF